MNKYDFLSIIAPISAPAAPATMLVNILYADLMRESVNQIAAMGAAVASGIGAEAAGMIAAYVGIQAYRKQKYGLMVVAIVAFIIYAAFMALGISVSQNPMTMISTIAISIIAYLAVGTYTALTGITDDETRDAQTKIAVMEAERKLTNAQTRNAKAGANESYTKPSETYRKTDWRNVPEEDRAHIAKMRTNEIMVFYHVSERTAQNWRKNAIEQVKP